KTLRVKGSVWLQVHSSSLLVIFLMPVRDLRVRGEGPGTHEDPGKSIGSISFVDGIAEEKSEARYG
ncbi:MAG: hypothetical protein ACREKF_12040, partial [Candidatus Methylomirabilales bacterium]